jgi:hypothetical protein
VSSWENDLEAAADRELRRRAVPPFRPDPDLIGWIEGPGPLEVIRWRWRRWRARHYVRAAELAYRREPNARNRDALERADLLLRRVDAARP